MKDGLFLDTPPTPARVLRNRPSMQPQRRFPTPRRLESRVIDTPFGAKPPSPLLLSQPYELPVDLLSSTVRQLQNHSRDVVATDPREDPSRLWLADYTVEIEVDEGANDVDTEITGAVEHRFFDDGDFLNDVTEMLISEHHAPPKKLVCGRKKSSACRILGVWLVLVPASLAVACGCVMVRAAVMHGARELVAMVTPR